MTTPSEDRQSWSRPELTSLGTVAEMTATVGTKECCTDEGCESQPIIPPLQ